MTILYFAWVRQKTGRSEEVLTLPDGIRTVADLVSFLVQRGDGFADAFSELKRIRVAVNQEHVSFDKALSNDDEVAFFPPVTGG